MKMKIQLHICLQVILWLWFERTLQDAAAGTSPTSVSDANLMFECVISFPPLYAVLVGRGRARPGQQHCPGRQGDGVDEVWAKAFLSEINDNIPRSLSSMVQMATTLEGQRKRRPLTPAQFDRLVLSMVYSAYQAWHQEEQEAWGEVLLQLANITVQELRGSYLFNYA
ncbi:hypothetical protein L3Q82_023881 [Scortum barcoo]|uniref:Uncharacterized protein n=1 Tax=Scortum barcoo TaxID=214431 RepID=A0ACB8WUD4_9TELE|nr:hypothetical protein L3Q82_023881 [Scortum barcoo]